MSGNHEDAIIASENFTQKAKCQFVENVYIPIYEYSMLQPIYQNIPNSYIYFPSIGQNLRENIVAINLQPKTKDIGNHSGDLKHRMLVLLKNMSVSDLLNISNKTTSDFTVDQIRTKINDGKVTGIKIHQMKKDVPLVDANLQGVLDKLHSLYIKEHVIEAFDKFSNLVGDNYAKHILKKYLVFKDSNPTTNRKDMLNCVYLIELEISSEHHSFLGDKFCNRLNTSRVYK